MLQLAYHISTGIPLWEYPVRKGSVLYLALEDNYHRLQERLYRMFGTDNTPDLHFSVSANQLGKGLVDQLGGFVHKHRDTHLIIIDTLQKVREIGGESYSYSNDYEIITQQSRGLSTRNSLSKALEQQGFSAKTNLETPAKQWTDFEKQQLSEIMKKRSIEWEQLGTHNEHLSVLDFKKQEREKEVPMKRM